MPVCSGCSADHPKDEYTKSQLGKKDARRCKLCIVAEEIAEPAVDDADAPAASKKKRRSRKKKQPSSANSPLALLDLAKQEAAMSEYSGERLRAADELLKSGTVSINERNKATAFKQAATRTWIPGQPLPRKVKDAVARALLAIEAEDAAACPHASAEEKEKPFDTKPPSASSDQRVLRRQKIMLERMRKKQSDANEKKQLALIDPVEAENCRRYNMSVNQLRAVRRVNLKLPHECRELHAAKALEAAFEDEDVLYEDDMSLDDMFGALKEDDKFMGRR